PLFKLVKLTPKLAITLVVLGLPLTYFKATFLNIFSAFLLLDSMKAKAEIYSQVNFSIIGLLSFYFVRVIIPLPFVLFLNRIKVEHKLNTGLLFSFILISVFAQIIVGFERFLNYIYIWIIVQFINEVYRKEFNYIRFFRRNVYKLSFLGMLFFIIFY